MKLQLLTLPLITLSLLTGCSQKVEADQLKHQQEHQALEAQDWATTCINQQETTMSFLGAHRLTSVSLFADENCQTLKHNSTTFDDIEISSATQNNGSAQIQAIAKELKSKKNQDISLIVKDNILEYTETNTPSLNSDDIKVFLALQ